MQPGGDHIDHRQPFQNIGRRREQTCREIDYQRRGKVRYADENPPLQKGVIPFGAGPLDKIRYPLQQKRLGHIVRGQRHQYHYQRRPDPAHYVGQSGRCSPVDQAVFEPLHHYINLANSCCRVGLMAAMRQGRGPDATMKSPRHANARMSFGLSASTPFSPLGSGLRPDAHKGP